MKLIPFVGPNETPMLFPEQETKDVLTESVGICASALMQLKHNKKLYGIFSIICFCVLLGSTSFDFQGVWNLGFILIRVVLILILVFLIIMGTFIYVYYTYKIVSSIILNIINSYKNRHRMESNGSQWYPIRKASNGNRTRKIRTLHRLGNIRRWKSK